MKIISKHLLVLFRRWQVLLLCLLLLGLVLGVFFPSLRGAFIHFDDYSYVTGNPNIQFTPGNLIWALTHGIGGNWHPLTQWSLMLDCQLYGLEPWGYHLSNLLLHAVNSVLLFLILRQMTGATWRSLMVAALFGLHPLRVESVAWISERKDVLSVLLWILTLGMYVRYVAESKVQNPRSKVSYCLALLFFALGLMSKPMVVSLPFVLLLLDYWPLERCSRQDLRGSLVEKAPFFLLSASFCVVTFVVQQNGGMMNELANVSVNLSCADRLENALVSYARYLDKIFWPSNLCAMYPHPGHWPIGTVLLAGLLILAVSTVVFAGRRRWPYAVTGWCWFLGTLVPVIGLVQVGVQSMADRYSYIPSIGILIVLVWGVHQATGQWKYQRALLGVAGGGMLLACSVLTRHQVAYWQDEISVWSRAVAVTENNYEAHNRLARAFLMQGRVDRSVPELQEAIRLNPGFVEAYCNLGYAFDTLGREDDAIACYQKAVALSPDYIAADNRLGTLLLKKGRLVEAINCFRKAVELEPDSSMNQHNLGYALSQQGLPGEALIHFQKAAALDPDNELNQYYVGSFLVQSGRADEAIGHFRAALKLRPDLAEIHYELGHALLVIGAPDEAIRELQAAARLKPGLFEAHAELGNALFQLGRFGEAIPEFQESVKLKPDQAEVRAELGFSLLQSGRLDEAIREYQVAVKLKPGQAEVHANLGDAYLKQQRIVEAVREFQTAVRLKPDQPEAHSNLGYALTKQGRLDEAIREFQAVVKLKPDDIEASNDLAYAISLKKQPPAPVQPTGTK